MTENNKTGLMFKALVRILAAIPMLMLLFFLPAGTFDYWQAWVYLVVLIALVAIAAVYLRKKDPDLLKRRLESREKHADQSRIIKASSVALLLIFILPGLDHRFGWSQVPPAVVIIAVILVILSYGFILLVWRANSYAARTVKVEEGQNVITNGPYALVRHPMYMGLMFFYILSPLALGSWWAVIPSLLIIPILVVRIVHEERLLANELAGYKDYMKSTRYRLIPGIW